MGLQEIIFSALFFSLGGLIGLVCQSSALLSSQFYLFLPILYNRVLVVPGECNPFSLVEYAVCDQITRLVQFRIGLDVSLNYHADT